MKAIWQGQVIAESEDTVVVERNHYFPLDSLQQEYIQESRKKTFCPWKGTARYYTLVVNGETNVDAAWYYPKPKSAAASISDRVAFWRGVQVVD